MKIRTSGHQAFNVPNDEEGRKFLEMVRRYRNKGWTYRARGRGPRSAPEGVFDPHFGSPASISQANSEWMALYLHSKRGATFNTVLSAIRGDYNVVHSPAASKIEPDDTTELTPDESEFLEKIVKLAAGMKLWTNSEKEIMDSLANKLID